MKEASRLTAMVFDYGTFISVGEKLAETYATVYYYTPFDDEYLDARRLLIGTNMGRMIRVHDWMDYINECDLFIFLDAGMGHIQRYLRSLGKPVWGSLGGSELEYNREHFYKTVEAVGLPVAPYHVCYGLDDLEDLLKHTKDKFVKISYFRNNMETWKHTSYELSKRRLDSLRITFGGAASSAIFIVQDCIDTEIEGGYDGWCIDGHFAPISFQGYEKKNELYLASAIEESELPDEIARVNRAFAPVLRSYRYRNFWATEIRISDGEPYFIDPTPRMPGQSGEHLPETIANFADVIWHGANGLILKPILNWRFAAEATLHYEAMSDDPELHSEWYDLDIPDAAARWTKLYRCFKGTDGLYHFPPNKSCEPGVVIGRGDTVEDAIKDCIDHLQLLKDLPVHANVAGFVSLIKQIREAEEAGIAFGGKIPRDEDVLRDIEEALE